MIPQTCKYSGHKYECGLSISCVLGGGKPLDLCSGGMIWSCCINKDRHNYEESIDPPGQVNNSSE